MSAENAVNQQPVLHLVEGGAGREPVARVRGEPMLEMPPDLYIPPDALEVFLDAFEGPLDLLLYLIRKANVDILDIPMARAHRAVPGVRRGDAPQEPRARRRVPA